MADVEFDINPFGSADIEIIVPRPTRLRPVTFDRSPYPAGLHFRNDSGETIPAHAVMQPTGMDDNDRLVVLKVTKPNSTPSDVYFLNGPREVKAGEYGRCADLPAYALYGETFDNQANQIVGPKSGEWKLFRFKSGFTALSTPVDDPRRIVVGPAPVASYGMLSGNGQEWTPSGGVFETLGFLMSTPLGAEFGLDVDTSDNTITVDRDGAYHCAFTASVRYTSHSGASPVFALHKNGTGYLSPSISAQIELNNSSYRSVAFAGVVRINAGDVLDVRINSVAQELRFQLCQFTVHLVGVA